MTDDEIREHLARLDRGEDVMEVVGELTREDLRDVANYCQRQADQASMESDVAAAAGRIIQRTRGARTLGAAASRNGRIAIELLSEESGVPVEKIAEFAGWNLEKPLSRAAPPPRLRS
jgi:hypothetical protein